MKQEKIIGNAATKIGNVAVKFLSIADKIKMNRLLSEGIFHTSKEKFFEALIQVSCYKIDSEGNFKEILKSEISKFEFEDFENISKIYLEGNSYLYSTLKKSNSFDKIDFSQQEVPMKENETYQDYLFRLETEQDLKLKASFKKNYGSILNLSKNIKESIIGNYIQAEQISNNLNSSSISKGVPISSIIGSSDEQSPTIHRPFRVVGFQDLTEKIEELISVTNESVDFAIQSNILQTKIADELKGSSLASTKFSKMNILISCIVLLISIFSFGFSIYSLKSSDNSSTRNSNSMINILEKINTSINDESSEIELLENRIIELESKMDSISNRNRFLEKKLKQ